MRPSSLLLAAPLALALAAPAGAACVDEIEQVEQALAKAGDAAIEPGAGQEEAVEPVESWFGDTLNVEELQGKLEDARKLAQDGDEQGCLQQVNDVRTALPQDAKQN